MFLEVQGKVMHFYFIILWFFGATGQILTFKVFLRVFLISTYLIYTTKYCFQDPALCI